MTKIEKIARDYKCKQIKCDVYDKSEYARKFYENKGYFIYGTTETLKYKEFKMRKEI